MNIRQRFCLLCMAGALVAPLIYAHEQMVRHLDRLVSHVTLRFHSHMATMSAQQIQTQYPSGALARVRIDGYAGQFIVEACLAHALARVSPSNAISHAVRAVQYAGQQPGAPERLFTVLSLLVRLHDEYGVASDIDSAAGRAWMSSLARDNAVLQQLVEIEHIRYHTVCGHTNEILAAVERLQKMPCQLSVPALECLADICYTHQRYAEAFRHWLAVLRAHDVVRDVALRGKALAALNNLLACADDSDLAAYQMVLCNLPMAVPATPGMARLIAELRELARHDPTVYEFQFRTAITAHTPEAEQTVLQMAEMNPFEHPPHMAAYIEELASRARAARGDIRAQRGMVTEALTIWLTELETLVCDLACSPLHPRILQYASCLSPLQSNQYGQILSQQIDALQKHLSLLDQHVRQAPGAADVRLLPDKNILSAGATLTELRATARQFTAPHAQRIP